ncbi:Receptor-like kinase lip2 [Heracleum sosnowskyi]|uniref:non-specific serine/threonine protein kinase n=1 Tax=Heracleum sosnowskyi TaxID=360622 RepID=A0AAD8HC41_9APIA|nr:Receptor-like kinase lip2 [Heracleum sosnowskyi]
MNDQKTSIFGLSLWVILGVSVGAAFVLLLFIISICFTSKRNNNIKNRSINKPPIIPNVTRDIQEIKLDKNQQVERLSKNDQQGLLLKAEEENSIGYHQRIQIEIGKDHRILYPVEKFGGGSSSGEAKLDHHHVAKDNTHVAVKNLLNNRGQAEKEFEVEVEAIGRVRHKNLVRLLGYCAEGAHRMLVYEFVNNGNLEQWLHGEVGPYSPLTWEIRMNIILGTAKGLSYLHEGLEPKVIHRDIKSSNILLDKHWNSKVADFGLAKLLGSERSYTTTRVMGTFGYVAPEYASTGMLNDKSDVYSFGILVMELISGRYPVDNSRPPDEVHLVEWLKQMVANRNSEGVLDPKLQDKPSLRSLRRAILVALRCVDPNTQKRPKMGHVVHMLEAEDSYNERRAGKGPNSAQCDEQEGKSIEKPVKESGETSR